jgi:hypothetical protein
MLLPLYLPPQVRGRRRVLQHRYLAPNVQSPDYGGYDIPEHLHLTSQNITASFTDTTAARTLSVLETIGIVEGFGGCPLSFTASQVVIAGGRTFVAPNVIVTSSLLPSVITFGYSAFTLNMLSTVRTVEVVRHVLRARNAKN